MATEMTEGNQRGAAGWTAPYMGHEHLYRPGSLAFASVVVWPTFTEAHVYNGQSRRAGSQTFRASEHADHTAAAKRWAETQLANIL